MFNNVGMKTGRLAFLCGLLVPMASFASNEGVPSYYQSNNTMNANQTAYGQYASQGLYQVCGAVWE